MKHWYSTAILLIPLAGCALWSDFKHPETAAPERWKSETATDAKPAWPDTQWWKQFNASPVQVSRTLDRQVAPGVLAALQDNFAEFRLAYEEDGLKLEDFVRYGASVHTLDQFISAYHKVLVLVRQRIFLNETAGS